jgi:anti-sigma regulatory factor (Ser/Thr protein kinase)
MTAACSPPPTGYRPVLRHAALDLGPLPTAVPCARLHARHVLREWGLADIADDSELVVAELVTNAVRAAARITAPAGPPPVRLRLTARPHGVQIEVWDASIDLPRPGPADPDDGPGGRGLIIIAALTTRHGAYPTDGGGKCVFAVIERRSSDD